MEKPWTAVEVVDEGMAKRLIEGQFSELGVVELEYLGSGWDNTVYRVNREWVFRFPRRPLAAEFMETEMAVLPKIADRLSVAVTKPVYVGKPAVGYPYAFAGMRYVPGKTACGFRLSEEERGQLVTPIAQFLKELHGISLEDARAAGAEDDKIARALPSRCVPDAIKKLVQAQELGVLEEVDGLIVKLNESIDLDVTEFVRLLHGDFYCRHIVLDETKRLAGVIDWGDLNIGHPARDLGVVKAFLPKGSEREFESIYGEVSDEVWKLATMSGIYHSVTLLLYGYDIGDEDLVFEGQRALRIMG